MSHIGSNYDLLIQKLDEFIRKYYINQLIKGAIYSLTLILILFLTFNVAEYYLHLSTTVRTILFFGFISISGIAIYLWAGLPLMHYFRLGSVISHDRAAQIIGIHFSNVEDRLLNILQLKRQSEGMGNRQLIEASIDQKIETLKPVPFSSAINLRQNRRYARYLILPFLVLVIILLGSPNILKEGTTRLLYHRQYFEKKAPFEFVIINDELSALQYEDMLLKVRIEGEALPEEAFINTGNHSYRLKRNKGNEYEHQFINLQGDIGFYFDAQGFRSRDYELNVLPKPMITSFEAFIDYPAYIGKEDEQLSNIGDFVVAEGTKINWKFNTRNTEDIKVDFKDSTHTANREGEELFGISRVFYRDAQYTVKVSNDNIRDADSITYSVNVVPDMYPTIAIEQYKDSINEKYVYYLGEVTDDYGLRSLYFKYKILDEKGGGGNRGGYELKNIPVASGRQASSFNYLVDMYQFNLKPGERVDYFFEVWDNDAINGSKSSRSSLMTYRMPTKDEFDQLTEKNNEEIKDDLESAMKQAEKLKKNIEDVKDRLLQKKELSWEDKKAIEDLVKEQRELQKKVESTQEKNKQNVQQQSEYKEVEENLAEKQKQLQELFDKIFDDEMKKLFEKLESMLDEMNKEEMLEQLEDMELTDEQLEKELDRMLSLFKKLEFEQKLTETIEELDELAKDQDELGDETLDEKKSDETLTKEQQALNDRFEKVKQDVTDLKKMNEEMGNDNKELSDVEQQQQQVEQEMGESVNNLQNSKTKKASQNQKNAAQQMQQMAQKMSDMQQQMQMEQAQEDMNAIRQLLENLVMLSFDQEALIDDLRGTNINNPEYVRLVQEQNKLKDDMKVVEDSLFALSKRVFQIQSFVSKEIKDIKWNMEKGIEELAERRVPNANKNQQYVMTGFNNLALMLSEVMQQMQQQMAQQMQGNQMCQQSGNNPKPGMPNMSQMQNELNKQMQEMQKQMEKGQVPGGKSGMSKQMAEMAAKQAAIRNAMQKLNQQENKDGKNSLGDLQKMIDEMDKTETELVNKQLTEEMVKRQQDILTRLLKAEEAMRERETEEQRKSESAQQIAREMPPSLEEYLKKREAEIELYKTVPPALNPYYKILVEKYFKSISF